MGKAHIADSGERMIPETHRGMHIYDEHMSRYSSVTKTVAGKRVLDIACGTGYGSKMLAQTAKHVYGVDISEESIAYAKDWYGAPNLDFITGSAESIPLEDNSVDIVVSFETIEHIPDYRKFLDEVKRVLVPGGQFIVSTPNDPEFPEGNHFHLHEFGLGELQELLDGYFKQSQTYYQAVWLMSAVLSAESFSGDKLAEPIDVFKSGANIPDRCLYITIVCSDAAPTFIESVGYFSEIWSERAAIEVQKQVGDSNHKVKEYKAEIKRLQAAKSSAEDKLAAMTRLYEATLPQKARRAVGKIKKTIHHSN